MDYYQEKGIVTKLLHGLSTGVAATFQKRDEENILDLIAHDMVKANAFQFAHKTRYGSQNLSEAVPVTAKGRALFAHQEWATVPGDLNSGTSP